MTSIEANQMSQAAAATSRTRSWNQFLFDTSISPLGDEGIIVMASSLGDFIARISLSAGTLVLVTVLSGGNISLGLIFFFWMWWAEMLGWGCYFDMAHGAPPPPNGHGDCAGHPIRMQWRNQGAYTTASAGNCSNHGEIYVR